MMDRRTSAEFIYEVAGIPEDYREAKGVDRRLVKSCKVSRGMFCDVGGGSGVDSLTLAYEGLPGICLDINLKLIKIVKQRSERLGLKGEIEFVTASATFLPFRTGCFELVTSFSVVDHLPDKKAAAEAIKEFSRVTARHGYVVVTIPNKLFLLGTLMMRLQNSFFEQRFTPKELEGYFESAGLSVFNRDSQYPTKAGPTILNYNLPSVAKRVPEQSLTIMLSVASRIFNFVQSRLPFWLFGARFGVAAKKNPEARAID
jgi:SAM-dependent methyltransferase